MAAVAIEELCHHYGSGEMRRQVLQDISLTGQHVTLASPSQLALLLHNNPRPLRSGAHFSSDGSLFYYSSLFFLDLIQ